MLAGASPAKLRKLEKLGLLEPVKWDLGGPPRPKSDDPEDDENPADGVSVEFDPIDGIEAPIEESDLLGIAEAFTVALIWASQAKTLVDMGWRIHAMVALFRPVVLEGMDLEVRTETQLELQDSLSLFSIAKDLIRKVGEYYRTVLAWCVRTNSLSLLGQRGFAMVYVMRRDLLRGRNTNAALGAMNRKTRQAFNKTVGDFRDSNSGFRNGVMRDETTRIKCRIAQTSGH